MDDNIYDADDVLDTQIIDGLRYVELKKYWTALQRVGMKSTYSMFIRDLSDKLERDLWKRRCVEDGVNEIVPVRTSDRRFYWPVNGLLILASMTKTYSQRINMTDEELANEAFDKANKDNQEPESDESSSDGRNEEEFSQDNNDEDEATTGETPDGEKSDALSHTFIMRYEDFAATTKAKVEDSFVSRQDELNLIAILDQEMRALCIEPAERQAYGKAWLAKRRAEADEPIVDAEPTPEPAEEEEAVPPEEPQAEHHDETPPPEEPIFQPEDETYRPEEEEAPDDTYFPGILVSVAASGIEKIEARLEDIPIIMFRPTTDKHAERIRYMSNSNPSVKQEMLRFAILDKWGQKIRGYRMNSPLSALVKFIIKDPRSDQNTGTSVLKNTLLASGVAYLKTIKVPGKKDLHLPYPKDKYCGGHGLATIKDTNHGDDGEVENHKSKGVFWNRDVLNLLGIPNTLPRM